MTTETNEKPQTEKTPRDFKMLAISVPNDLAEQVETMAKSEKKPAATIARRFIAEAMGYDISQFERTRKRGRVPGLTDEERKANAIAAQRERAALVKALMAKYQSGDIEVSEEELSKVAAETKPRKPRNS